MPPPRPSAYTPADYSYFSPHAPYTSPSSAPNLAHPAQTQTTTAIPGGPVITSIMSTRAPHMHPPDVLQQFALQIPPPPPLTLALRPRDRDRSSAAAASPGAGSSSSSSSSAASPAPATAAAAAIALGHHPPQMALASTPARHTLSVLLPRNIQPEMVTISANKGDRIRVVADAFGGDECHYEWQISFPPHDIDMAAVHARVDADGRLTLDVKRRPRPVYF